VPIQAVPAVRANLVPTANPPPVPVPAVDPAVQVAQSLITKNDSFFVSINNEFDVVLDSFGKDFLCLNLDSVGGLPAPPRKSKEFD